MKNLSIFVEKPPLGLSKEYGEVLTAGAIMFVAEMVEEFKHRVQQLHIERQTWNLKLQSLTEAPSLEFKTVRDSGDWQIAPLPERLRNRHLDLGDVSAANKQHFIQALHAPVQGIQVDFDDGHCPTWRNTILAHYHVMQAVHNEIEDIDIAKAPIMMHRPRAWNMTEYHCMVNGRAVPGAIFDFALHCFHNGKTLHSAAAGPYFYLSKLEASTEAALWNDIFIYTQNKLQIAKGTIKACVLIENILACFQMDAILFELREHSLGLNCGIWDYCASIVAKLGHLPQFLLPDRTKYVDMDKHFLQKYMELAVKIANKRGAPATGGMAAILGTDAACVERVVSAKRKEIQCGVSGFMVYDVKLVAAINKLWKEEIIVNVPKCEVTRSDLLRIPTGGVTLEGLKRNIDIAVLFVESWMQQTGHFVYKGSVEDSATAEISRYQITQWIHHCTPLEDSAGHVTVDLVKDLLSRQRNQGAAAILYNLVTLKQPPEFITTYLAEEPWMREGYESRAKL